MKLRILLLPVLIFVFHTGFCQRPDNPNSLSISLGPSIPLASFSKKDISSISDGFAKTGSKIDFGFEHAINRKIGFAADVSIMNNPIDTRSIAKQYGQKKFYYGIFVSSDPSQPPPPITAFPYDIYSNWKFDHDAWWSVSVMVGPTLRLPFGATSNKCFLTLKAMAGVIYLTSPKISGISHSDTSSASSFVTSSSKLGFSVKLATGFLYQFQKRLAFVAAVDYRYAGPFKLNVIQTFSAAKMFNTNTPYAYSYKSQNTGRENFTKLNMQTLSVSVGIVFTL